MKNKRVLIGLIVTAFIGLGQFATAQTKANYHNNLIEIGPDNIGGRVRAIVVDEADANHTTLYAGGVAGGLYKKVGDQNWVLMPFINEGHEVTLPISYMIQLHDNTILIATGEGFVDDHGFNQERMAPRGRGLYLFNPADNSFTLVAMTDPDSHPEWSYINKLAYLERDGYLYLYAATNEGLYRWKLSSENPDWNAAPSQVATGKFQDICILSADNMAYASAPGKLYRIGNVTGESAAIDITAMHENFVNATRIELEGLTSHVLDTNTGAYIHTTFLYALVVDSAGLLDGVYLTKNQQSWVKLTTSTVAPFNSNNPGTLNASLTINPRNYSHIYVGGANVFEGEGFVENSLYQWTTMTSTESNLNGGNYMGQVYSNPNFVHSGVHQIINTFEVNEGDTAWVMYFATDGGVFKGTSTLYGNTLYWSFTSLNKGMNTVQFNHIAVCPDGSIIGGAIDNACPFIQSRNAHFGSVPSGTWYDTDSTSIMNHIANVLWLGNGGGVDASMFQQILPHTRRSIFVSSEPGVFSFQGSMSVNDVASMARACDDYADYTNTQTWTIAEAFLADQVATSNPIPQMKLWETTNNTSWNDSINITLDTLGTYIHDGETLPLTGSTEIVPGDKILVSSAPAFNYPFYHTFTTSFVAREQVKQRIHNPVISRIIVNGRTTQGKGAVYMNMTPNYYRNVWDINEANSSDDAVIEKLMHWAQVYCSPKNYSVGNIAWSRDGESIYFNVILDSTGESFIMHLYDFTGADVNNAQTMKNQLYFENPATRITHYDSIFAPDGNWFKRPVSNIAVDPRDGEDNLIITFAGYDNNGPNMVYVENASNSATRNVRAMNITSAEFGMTADKPVYSALIECTTGAIYAGTENGVFVSPSAISPAWTAHGEFNGVPVTSITQQTKALPRVRYEARDGINMETYLFAKTKYPYAIYFGTYGRGVFMDTTYVVDHVSEICDSDDWAGITTVDKGDNSVKIYPNPAVDHATVELSVVNAGNAVVNIYDINGKLVHTETLGYLNEGTHQYSIDCTKFSHGMYLMNIRLGNNTATSKLIVR